MELIQAAWEKYKGILMRGAPTTLIDEEKEKLELGVNALRGAFFAGAASVHLVLVMISTDQISEEDGERMLAAMDAEIMRHATGVKQG